MKTPHNLKKITLLLGDIMVLYASLWLTLLLRYQAWPSAERWQGHFLLFTPVFAGWLLIFYIANLYDLKQAVNNARFWQLLFRSLALAIGLAVIFFYLLPRNNLAPKTNLLIYSGLFVVLFSAWRQFYNWSLEAYLPKTAIALIGWNDQVKELIGELDKAQLGYRVAFVIDDRPDRAEPGRNIPVYPDTADLKRLVLDHKVGAIVFTDSPRESASLREALFACLPLKLDFVSLPLFYETITGKVPVSAISQAWFLENLSEGGKAAFDAAKRGYDLLLGMSLLLITSPLWLLLAVLIRLESKGPAFFTQIRLGRHGRPFKIYKFRTMAVAGNDFAPTAKDDKRVTRLGRFLRASRLDELPQLLNIVRGEMSFVGPRPERPELVTELEKIVPFYRERMLVKPGVTGWDQVSGEYHSPSHEDTMKKLQYDLYYIKNRSIYLDLSIILKTIYTVITRNGV